MTDDGQAFCDASHMKSDGKHLGMNIRYPNHTGIFILLCTLIESFLGAKVVMLSCVSVRRCHVLLMQLLIVAAVYNLESTTMTHHGASAFSLSGLKHGQSKRSTRRDYTGISPPYISGAVFQPVSQLAQYGKGDPNDSFMSGKTGYSSENAAWKVIVSTLRKRFLTLWFRWRKTIRYFFQKCTIYVLECEHGKYYVGSTFHKRQRLKQHFDKARSGSVWTNLHKPIRVLELHTRIPNRYRLGMESQVTAKLMWKRGVNSVRGAMYSQPRIYTQQKDDMESLVGFLGHYNDLSYKEVRERLEEELPSSSSRSNSGGRPRPISFKQVVVGDKPNTKTSLSQAQTRCYKCGEFGHYAGDCTATSRTCFVCGELGHVARNCPDKDTAKNDIKCYACGGVGHMARDCPNK